MQVNTKRTGTTVKLTKRERERLEEASWLCAQLKEYNLPGAEVSASAAASHLTDLLKWAAK